MELSVEKLENYQKNLRCLQELTQELLSRMKGHDVSFQAEITDQEGDFSGEKLRGLMEEMLSLWADTLRIGRRIDPNTGENVAEPYLRDRMELYGCYLYLVMRCSLCQGGYSSARGGAEKKERTDFAFLLEQAKRLSQSWCVTVDPEGTKKNELISGYDEHFGFHLYHPFRLYLTFRETINQCEDLALTPNWSAAMERLDRLTNEGNTKRISFLRHPLRSRSLPAKAEEPENMEPEEEEPEDDFDFPEEDGYSAEDFDLQEDNWDLIDPAVSAEFWEAERERVEAEINRESYLQHLVQSFDGLDEYLSVCRRFQERFEQAPPQVLWGFYGELEEIVNLYLAQREAAPLSDMDKTLDVYSRIYDGPLRQAKRCARGLKWNNL